MSATQVVPEYNFADRETWEQKAMRLAVEVSQIGGQLDGARHTNRILRHQLDTARAELDALRARPEKVVYKRDKILEAGLFEARNTAAILRGQLRMIRNLRARAPRRHDLGEIFLAVHGQAVM